MLLEKLTVRDGRSLDEAIAIVRNVDPSLDGRSVRALAERLPLRPARLRLLPLLDDDEQRFVAPDAADSRASEADARRVSARAARVVRETIATLPLRDRMLIRFHFGAELSIADAARVLGVPQRPLYRRIEALLRQLREALEQEGVGLAAVEELISAGEPESSISACEMGKTGLAVTPMMWRRPSNQCTEYAVPDRRDPSAFRQRRHRCSNAGQRARAYRNLQRVHGRGSLCERPS